MNKDKDKLEGQIKAWYDCPHCDETHLLNIRYNKVLALTVDVVKEVLESAMESFRYEVHKLHGIDREVELDMDRLFFCEV